MKRAIAFFWIPLTLVLLLAISTEGFVLNTYDDKEIESGEEKDYKEPADYFEKKSAYGMEVSKVEPEKEYYEDTTVVEIKPEPEREPEPEPELVNYVESRGSLAGRSLPAKSLPRLG